MMVGGAIRIFSGLKPGFFLVLPLITVIVLSSSSVAEKEAALVNPAPPADAEAAAPAAAEEVPLAERPLSAGSGAEGEEVSRDNDEGEEEGIALSTTEGKRVSLPPVKGVRTTIAAATMLILFLLVHLITVGSDVSKIESLSVYENRHLGSAALLAGMLISGLGDLISGLRLRSSIADGIHLKKWKGLDERGKPQMAVGAVLYVAMIAATLGLGSFAGIPQLAKEVVSLVAAGLFLWGVVLYVDPWGMGNDD